MSGLTKILDIENLNVSFDSDSVKTKVVKDISLEVYDGEILAIVGESGSGKSVAMKSVMDLLPVYAKVSADRFLFEGKKFLEIKGKEKRQILGNDIAMIFQDPMTALNPVKKIGDHLIENIRRHNKMSKKQAESLAIEMLERVGIPSPEKRMKQYPHEFSGGMRQRVLIAMALCSRPRLLIADEPTTALDVTIQAQILKLLKNLHETEKMNIVLITHDLGVVASIADRIAVMYGGRIMETGTKDEILYNAQHPYTKALLKAIPGTENGKKCKLEPIPGSVPQMKDMESGCPFYSRCEHAGEACLGEFGAIHDYSDTHKSYCMNDLKQLNERGA